MGRCGRLTQTSYVSLRLCMHTRLAWLSCFIFVALLEQCPPVISEFVIRLKDMVSNCNLPLGIIRASTITRKLSEVVQCHRENYVPRLANQ